MKYFILVLLPLLFGSCQKPYTVELHIQARDHELLALEKAEVFLDHVRIGQTDKQGNFKYQFIAENKQEIKLELLKSSDRFYFSPFFKKITIYDPVIKVKATLYRSPKPRIQIAKPQPPPKPNPYPLNNLRALEPLPPNSTNSTPPLPKKTKKTKATTLVISDTRGSRLAGAELYWSQGKNLHFACQSDRRGKCRVKDWQKQRQILIKHSGFYTRKLDLQPPTGPKVIKMTRGTSLDIFALNKRHNLITGINAADIYINGKKAGQTDQLGHFSYRYQGPKEKLLQVSIEAKYYQPSSFTTDFTAQEGMTLSKFFRPLKPTSFLKVSLPPQVKDDLLQASLPFPKAEKNWDFKLEGKFIPSPNQVQYIELRLEQAGKLPLSAQYAPWQSSQAQAILQQLGSQLMLSFPHEGYITRINGKNLEINSQKRFRPGTWLKIYGNRWAENGKRQRETWIANARVGKDPQTAKLVWQAPRSLLKEGASLTKANGKMHGPEQAAQREHKLHVFDLEDKPLEGVCIYQEKSWRGCSDRNGFLRFQLAATRPLKLLKPGYYPKTLKISGLLKRSYEARLKPWGRLVKIASTPPATQIYLDGIAMGPSPLHHEYPNQDKVQIYIQAPPGYKDSYLEAKKGAVIDLKLELELDVYQKVKTLETAKLKDFLHRIDADHSDYDYAQRALGALYIDQGQKKRARDLLKLQFEKAAPPSKLNYILSSIANPEKPEAYQEAWKLLKKLPQLKGDLKERRQYLEASVRYHLDKRKVF